MDETFEKNLDVFSRFCPNSALEIQDIDCTDVQFCQTAKGELNLQKRQEGSFFFLHSQEGAEEEALAWFKTIPTLYCEAIFIFGIGLGYYYDAAKQWLKQVPTRFLVFLEDDLHVMKRFLETDKAAEILANPQVIIKSFNRPNENEWGKFRQDFEWIFWAFASKKIEMTSLKSYEMNEISFTYKLFTQLRMQIGDKEGFFYEIFQRSYEVYPNFYANLMLLPESSYGPGLFDKFIQIPSVVCGAGPSLLKHSDLLKKIEDKALIFGAGSSLNALTRNGIVPHFGAGLDSSNTQLSRIALNFAYEIPFFYTNRFSNEALLQTQGPKIYIGTSSLSRWFEEKLGLKTQEASAGSSTTTFCLEIARRLGCDPLLFVGLDLAYTNSTHYAKGVTVHPLDSEEEHEKIKKIEELFDAKDIYGSQIKTNWVWAREGAEYALYVQSNPETRFVNCTEGGLGIVDIPNETLKDTVDKYLINSYDISNLIHTEIQNNILHLSFDKIDEVLKEWKSSLQKCQDYCDLIVKELLNMRKSIGEEEFSEKIHNPKIILWETELHEEIAFHYLLKKINDAIELKSLLDKYPLEYRYDAFNTKERKEKTLSIHVMHYSWLKGIIEFHKQSIDNAIKTFLTRQENLKEKHSQSEFLHPQTFGETYFLKDGFLEIIDTELDIFYREPFAPCYIPNSDKPLKTQDSTNLTTELFFEKQGKLEGERLTFYPSGEIKGQSFYHSGNLHGPSTFCNKEGHLSAQSWFINGKRHGKTWLYYLTGEQYAVLRYKNGLKHGKQEYFYRDGTIKTLLNYSDGELHGDVLLFYPNGTKKKEIHFSNGTMQGIERVWSPSGILLRETKYRENQPVEKAVSWHLNGQKAKEITFYDNPEHFDLFEWDEAGNLVRKQLYEEEDSLKNLIEKSNELHSLFLELQIRLDKIKDL